MGAIERFNALAEEDARAVLSGCLGVPRWVEIVLRGRPYAGREELLRTADAAARTLDRDEVGTALAGHPRLGERAGTGHNVAESTREQAGVAAGGSELAESLARANAAYERRFGQVLLVHARGRDGADILAEAERRLENDQPTEAAEVVDTLRRIALHRLDAVV